MRQTANFFSPTPASRSEVVGRGRGWEAFEPRADNNDNREPPTLTVCTALRRSTLPTARKSSRGMGE
jgi:hypothetical protein